MLIRRSWLMSKIESSLVQCLLSRLILSCNFSGCQKRWQSLCLQVEARGESFACITHHRWLYRVHGLCLTRDSQSTEISDCHANKTRHQWLQDDSKQEGRGPTINSGLGANAEKSASESNLPLANNAAQTMAENRGCNLLLFPACLHHLFPKPLNAKSARSHQHIELSAVAATRDKSTQLVAIQPLHQSTAKWNTYRMLQGKGDPCFAHPRNPYTERRKKRSFRSKYHRNPSAHAGRPNTIYSSSSTESFYVKKGKSRCNLIILILILIFFCL